MNWRPNGDNKDALILLPLPPRRLICRVLFVLLGVTPLVALAVYAVWRHNAYSADGYERWLAAQLGLDVKIVHVVHAKPGVTCLEGLNLLDPEDGELIARCRDVEIHRGTEKIGLFLREVTLQPSHMQRAWQVLHERILRQRRLLSRPVLVAAPTVKLPGSGCAKLTDLRVTLSRGEAGHEATVMFRPGQDLTTPLARIHVARRHDDKARTTRLEIDTSDNILPLTLLAGGNTRLKGWGRHATFQGILWLAWDSHKWSGECSGQLREIQLGPLVQPRFGHELNGPANMTIRTAVFRDGRLESFAGRVGGGPGTISPFLVSAVCKHLGMRRPPGAPAMENVPQAYQQFAAELELDARGLTIRGACDGGGRGVAMNGEHAPLLLEPLKRPQPVAGLITALAGDEATPLVPVTDSTRLLISILPLPPR